ncbi:MAG: hypothetical protein KF886_02925 [Candidatus Hydrogenedentes bacterium]|nr:hypothetical protein [Candidatus Hydrogenedentota bacterium]
MSASTKGYREMEVEKRAKLLKYLMLTFVLGPACGFCIAFFLIALVYVCSGYSIAFAIQEAILLSLGLGAPLGILLCAVTSWSVIRLNTSTVVLFLASGSLSMSTFAAISGHAPLAFLASIAGFGVGWFLLLALFPSGSSQDDSETS